MASGRAKKTSQRALRRFYKLLDEEFVMFKVERPQVVEGEDEIKLFSDRSGLPPLEIFPTDKIEIMEDPEPNLLSETQKKREEINKLRKLGRNLQKAESSSHNQPQYEMCQGCLVLIDGVTNHDYCNSLKDYEKREKEMSESRKRKQMMADILKDHYTAGETPDNETEEKVTGWETDNSESLKQHKRLKMVKMKCMKCNFFTFSLEDYKAHEAAGHDHLDKTNEQFFHFPVFQGFECVLQGSRNTEKYFVTEVSQPASSQHDNLSDTCYFFVPERVMALNQSLVSQANVKIPYVTKLATAKTPRAYLATFPNSSVAMVKWATDRDVGESLVDQRSVLIMTKSRFKIIQSRTNNKSNLRAAFCSFIDSDKEELEQLVFSQTQSILLSSQNTQPGEDCSHFYSKKPSFLT